MHPHFTLRLASSEEMVEVLIRCLSAALVPALQDTDLEVDLDLERSDGRLNAVSLTFPHQLHLPVLHGLAAAVMERQDVVYVSGSEELCAQLQRIPLFLPEAARGAEPVRTPWVPPTEKALAQPDASFGDFNRLLRGWVFVSDAVRALRIRFGQGAESPAGECVVVHPQVGERAAYLVYARAVQAWCGSFQLPEHLAVGVRWMMDDEWKPAMGEWLLGLRPELACEVLPFEGGHACHVRGALPVVTLLERALLCLGTIVIGGSMEYLRVLRVMPDAGNRIFPAQVNPDPAMHLLVNAALRHLGARTTQALDDDFSRTRIIINQIGEPCVTVAGAPPFAEDVLVEVRSTLAEVTGDA